MDNTERTILTVEATIQAPVEKVWDYWTLPAHITKWCQASDDWHAPYAENNLQVGGAFKTTMAAKDGSMSFDFEGVYSSVILHQRIAYTMSDGRQVSITFLGNGDETTVVETFDAEMVHSLELQQGGWQAILDNFKNYTENH